MLLFAVLALLFFFPDRFCLSISNRKLIPVVCVPWFFVPPFLSSSSTHPLLPTSQVLLAGRGRRVRNHCAVDSTIATATVLASIPEIGKSVVNVNARLDLRAATIVPSADVRWTAVDTAAAVVACCALVSKGGRVKVAMLKVVPVDVSTVIACCRRRPPHPPHPPP